MRCLRITTSRASRLSLAIALLTGGRAACAQDAVREGLKVRLSFAVAPRVIGVIQSVTRDSLILFAEPAATRIGIARASVQSLAVSHGRLASEGAKKGALWGGAISGGLGTLTALALVSGASSNAHNTAGDVVLFALLTTAEGAGFGAIIGAFVKSERWQTVSAAPIVDTGASGFRLGLRIR